MPPASPEQTTPRESVMDVTQEQVARIYGQAYLGAVAGQPDRAGMVEELRSLITDVLDKYPTLEEVLSSALISHEEKERLIDKVLSSRASQRLVNLLKVLSAHGRLNIVRAVARTVEQMDNKQSGRIDVQLRLADQIDAGLQEEITKVLRSTFAAEPLIDVFVDPSLIAGFVVRVGDTVYDGSVKTQFEQARKSMVQRAIENIETRPEKFFNGET